MSDFLKKIGGNQESPIRPTDRPTEESTFERVARLLQEQVATLDRISKNQNKFEQSLQSNTESIKLLKGNLDGVQVRIQQQKESFTTEIEQVKEQYTTIFKQARSNWTINLDVPQLATRLKNEMEPNLNTYKTATDEMAKEFTSKVDTSLNGVQAKFTQIQSEINETVSKTRNVMARYNVWIVAISGGLWLMITCFLMYEMKALKDTIIQVQKDNTYANSLYFYVEDKHPKVIKQFENELQKQKKIQGKK